MALLLKDREAPSDAASPPPGGGAPVTTVDVACEACGAGMNPGQDWCLECGTAAPGRLGARPGWRSAFTVVAVTLLLVVGAVLASYAALSSDAERTAAAPSAGDGQPIPATGPSAALPPAALTPGETGPNTAPPVVPPPVAGKTIIPTTPPAVAKNTPVVPPATTKAPTATTKPPPPPAAAKTKTNTKTKTPAATGSQKATTAAVPKPETVSFRRDAAKTYDPAARAGAEFGPAANAVDKSPHTVWDVVVPADAKPIGAGLTFNLGKPYALRALRITTPTEGFGAEIYGAVSAAQTPTDILDKRWEHLTDIKSVTDAKIVSLIDKSKSKFQLLLIYVTSPGDVTDPRVAIGALRVTGTP